ncbi:MAG: hypothetical protein PHY34_00530 [Patescibacteria group bacterium]|nr:hypothetical protein [Patescibacteria group bacterium]MDD5715885.1 hypothetical protein [Patescibacteria group bacterium]
MNEKDIQSILQELYQIDPGLQQHEVKLRQLIAKFTAARPQPTIDESFRAQLRAQLLAHAQQFRPIDKEDARGIAGTRWFRFRNLGYALAGAAIVAVVMVVFFRDDIGTPAGNTTADGTKRMNTEVKAVGSNAFGVLTAQTAKSNTEESSDTAVAAERDAAGTGYGIGRYASDSVGTEPGVAPMPTMTSYRYVYQGAALSVPGKQLPVLKRVPESVSPSAFEKTNLGLINLSSFSDSTLQSFILTQSDDDRYVVMVSPIDGGVTISRGWSTWKSSAVIGCSTGMCADMPELTQSDVPADAELIEIADDFIAEHGINATAYGDPFVSAQWKQEYMVRPNDTAIYIPDVISVTYPLMVNGKGVYDLYGNVNGLAVEINLRDIKVSSVTGLYSQQYDSSTYDTEQDVSKILAVADRGGLFEYRDSMAENVIEIELGSPTIGYTIATNYNESTYQELLVPAFIFPVTKAPDDGTLYRERVVVPIIKDTLESADQGGGVPVLQTEPDVEPGVDAPVRAE